MTGLTLIFRELSQIRDWMIAAIDAENRKIYELGQNEEYKGMGTTIEVLAFVDNAVIFAHVGDSRIALIRNGEYKQLTNDHSLVNALIKAGQLTEEEAAVHPQRNIITRHWASCLIEADLGVQQLEPGDYILANSDGLTNMISIEQIVHIVNSPGFLEENESFAAANELVVLTILPLPSLK